MRTKSNITTKTIMSVQYGPYKTKIQNYMIELKLTKSRPNIYKVINFVSDV